ncbi:MAG: SufE family protein [bacterium]|nr:SufE family protein [Acidimicrobiia bacterium]MCY4649540.1 SufE family protein [bacterium]
MALPERLERILTLLQSTPRSIRGHALLDLSRTLPPLPPEYHGDMRDQLERVVECQTPFFLATRLEEDQTVRMFFDAPPQAPTIRGYAGLLSVGLDGEPAQTVLDLPEDFYYGVGLEEVVSPLRLRGMGAIVATLKNQVRRHLERAAA